jgi:glycosyltransferase involved in cell wall biosynthesis
VTARDHLGHADAEPDVYAETRSLARRVGARSVIELGCGAGSALVSLHPEFAVVGVDKAAVVAGCRERYDIGQWIDGDRETALDLPEGTLERSLVILTERGARHEIGWRACRSALDRGALAALIAVAERADHAAVGFRRLLAQHRLDAHVGRTSFSASAPGETVIFAVAPGLDARVREDIALWWSERQPWERQLMRLSSRPRTGPHAASDDVQSARVGNPHVTVVTESTGEDQLALLRTSDSLLTQTFDGWSWTIVSTKPIPPPTNDPRVATRRETTRAAGLAHAVAGAKFVAVVDEGVALHETTLEKWLWFLATHPQYMGVTGSDRSGMDARLFRGEAIGAAGGLDAAWATVEPLGRVAHSGTRRAATDEEQHPASDADHSGTQRRWTPDSWPFRNVLPKSARRILLIAPWMTLGGADRVSIDVLRDLRDAGWEITVATTRSSDHSLYPIFETITYDLFALADVVPLDDYPRMLDYLIDSRRPDVVLVSQSELGYRLLPFLRSRHAYPAFVDLCHSEANDWWEGGFPRFSIEYSSMLDRTIVVSRYLRDWMIDRGADPHRLTVCHANVDESTFVPDRAVRARVRRELGVSDDERIVLWVGRMSVEKQPRLLPSISAALQRRGTHHTLLVVGDGPERRVTEKLAAADRDARLLFLGERDHGVLPSLYAASDVALLPSRIEGIALTLFEAMAAGVPVVAARVGGQAELVTEDVGVLIDPEPNETEVDRYAAALGHLLDDPARLDEMSRAARARTEAHFTARTRKQQFLETLEVAIGDRSMSPRNAPDPRLGRAIASEVVELARLEGAWLAPPATPRSHRQRLYEQAQLLGGPMYRWALAHRIPGIRVARNIAHRVVVGR